MSEPRLSFFIREVLLVRRTSVILHSIIAEFLRATASVGDRATPLTKCGQAKRIALLLARWLSFDLLDLEILSDMSTPGLG